MKTISAQKLKAKLDQGDRFHLIMTMSADDEIVLYCTGQECVASSRAYHALERAGYRNVLHFEGGLAAWDAAGLPIEVGKYGE